MDFRNLRVYHPKNSCLITQKHLYDVDDAFWDNSEVMRQGFSKAKYQRSILTEITQYYESSEQEASSEKPREFNKRIFNKNLKFFEYVFKRWLHDDANQTLIFNFYNDLKKMFLKCAEIRGINPAEWK